MASTRFLAAFVMAFVLPVEAGSKRKKITLMAIPGISGWGLDFKPLVEKLDNIAGSDITLEPIYLNYTQTIEIGIDAFALKAIQILHSHVDLFDKESHYILLAHSAGGAVLSRLLDLLMNGESLVLGEAGDNAILTGGLDCYLQRNPLKECGLRKSHSKSFTRPIAVVDMEPSMLYFDATSRTYSPEAEKKLKNGDFAGLLRDEDSGHYNTTGNWAYDLWSKLHAPKEGWITNAIENKGWTWTMFRGLCQSLVQWCPESNPQAQFIAQYIKEGGNYTYVAGSKPDNRFRGHMVKLVLQIEFGLIAGDFTKERLDGDGKDFWFHEIPEAGHEMYADNLPVTSNLIASGLASDLPELFEAAEEDSEEGSIAAGLAKAKEPVVLFA